MLAVTGPQRGEAGHVHVQQAMRHAHVLLIVCSILSGG